MSKLTVVLDRKEMRVTPDAGAVRIDCPGRKLTRVPARMIDTVIVLGSPMVSCGVWLLLAHENVPTVILPSRGTGPAVFVGAGLAASANKRLRQYGLMACPKQAMTVARLLVRQKLEGQKQVLTDLGMAGPEEATRFDQALAQLENTEDRFSIMGVEGAAAAFYFQRIGSALPEKWRFEKRNRRPPRDPVNALLSLGYVLAANEVRGHVLATGLDPAVGFLHGPEPGRESLVLDLLEPVRPAVDHLMLGMVLSGSLSTKDFVTNEDDGCRLNKTGRDVFYPAWAAWREQGGLAEKIRQAAGTLPLENGTDTASGQKEETHDGSA